MLFLNRALVVAGLIGRALSAIEWSSEQWDAIIVGAGPAGIIGLLIWLFYFDFCIGWSQILVASRLSEAGLKTLLLEGGGVSYGVTGGDLNARRPVGLFLW